MNTAFATVAGIIIIPIILVLFYSAVKTEWPENYAAISADFGIVVNRTSVRYLIFRIAPAYLATLLVSTMVGRSGGNGMVAALVGAGAYACLTQGRHMVQVWRRRHRHRRLPAILVSATSAICIVVAAWLGGLGPGPFEFVVPPIDEFFKSFWTTILLALIAVAVVRYSRQHKTIDQLVERSRGEVGKDLIELGYAAADRFNVDRVLVESILLAENLERPSWVRRVEWLKSRFSPRGSYGVMQVHSDRPVSDEESIEIAVRDHLAGLTVALDEYGSYHSSSLKDVLKVYNPNPNFIELCLAIYGHLYWLSRRSQ